MKHNKLVRDKVPEVIARENGVTPVTHVASGSEYWTKLKEKLREEVNEFLKDDNEEELADVLEVVDAMLDFRKISKEKIESLRQKKAEEKGVFKHRIILDETK